MLKSRGLKWNKYPHREKWLIANLKDKPGRRPLGSATAWRKPTKDQHPNLTLTLTYSRGNPEKPSPASAPPV